MTVGIVAACKHEEKTAIVLCCDWQGTLGDFIKSDDTDKMRYIGTRATVLLAGTLTEADELVFECDAPVKLFSSKADPARSDPDMQEYLNGLRDAVARRKSALVKDYIRRTLSIDDRDFWQNGKQYLTATEHEQLLRKIMAIDLGTEIIIGSTRADDDDAIVRIRSCGLVSWEDQFSTIGSGGLIAESFLHQYDFADQIGLMTCLYRVYAAKVAAEKNPYVGQGTSFEILHGGHRFDLSDDGVKYLKKKVKNRREPRLEFKSDFLKVLEDEKKPKAP